MIIILLLCQCERSPRLTDNAAGTADLQRKIDSVCQAMLIENDVVGFSVAIARSGQTIYKNAFGHSDSLQEIPMRTDNIFTIASISKLVGSVMAMKLVGGDRIDLDATLAEMLPDFPNREQARKIRIRQLINNTSGLLDYAIELDTTYIETGKTPERQDYLDFFGRHDLLFEPGTRYAYSNSGFKLMALIVEEVTGNGYAEELDRIINQPGDLNFKLIASAIDDPDLPTYFDLIDSTRTPAQPWPWIYGDGGVTSTAEELALFAFKWANGTLLSKELFGVMCTPVELENGIMPDYGLGVRRGTFAGEPVVGHTGGNMSVMAMLLYFPEKELSIAVLDNTDGADNGSMVIAGHVGLTALGQGSPNLHALEETCEDLSLYVGEYEQYNYVANEPLVYSIVQYPGKQRLYRKVNGSDEQGQELFYLGQHTFAYERFPLDRIQFLMGDDGLPIAYRHYWNGLFKRMGFRK